MFASIHVPDFSVEAIVRHQPELRQKPVAIVDGKPPVLTVAGVNSLARQAGIELGMTKFQAEQFVDAAIRQRSASQEASAQAALLDCAGAFSPRVEDTSPGTVVLDIEGLDRLFGSATELAHNLSRQVSEAGLVAHAALASNPDAAICGARGGSGITIIESGAEAEHLKNFPIDILPLDVETYETLHCWGIRSFGDLGKLPAKELSERLGQKGVHLHRLACGRATRPLKPRKESPRFEESLDLDYSVALLEPLTFILNRLCDALFHRLRSRGLATREIDLTLQREHPRDPFVLPLRLPIPVENPRVAAKLFMLELEARPPGAPVAGIHIEATPSKPRVLQNGLFAPLSPEPEKLELTLARIAGVVGSGNVGSPELENAHARERFRMKHFGNSDLRIADFRLEKRREPAAFRVFRPALEATVQTRDGIPIWIGFSGVHGAIETASGPWRGSGDWWNAQHWSREEWDIAILIGNSKSEIYSKSLLVRIYRNALTGRWYAEGVYD